MADLISGFLMILSASLYEIFPVGLSKCNTEAKTSCNGLPLAPTTTSIFPKLFSI